MAIPVLDDPAETELEMLVPLAFSDLPALASRLSHFATELSDLAMQVPDILCGDVDLCEMSHDLNGLATALRAAR